MNEKTLFAVGFWTALLIFLLIALISYWSTKELIEVDQAVANSQKILHTLEVVKTELQNAIISQRDFIITGQEEDLKTYSTENRIVHQKIEELRTLTGNTREYQDTITMLTRDW